jgi:hypothetical protein
MGPGQRPRWFQYWTGAFVSNDDDSPERYGKRYWVRLNPDDSVQLEFEDGSTKDMTGRLTKAEVLDYHRKKLWAAVILKRS